MKITHQDIIDKEFRVKFRGFDMAEVDTFLEDVAEKFFKLAEENTQLNEKVLALQEDIESGDRVGSQGQMELPAEMVNFLEELKQDTAAINAEIVALKQDRSTFASLDKSIKEAVASLQKAAAIAPPQAQTELPADLNSTLEELKMNAEAIAAEMAAFKADRQAFNSLQKSLEEVVSAAKETAPAMPPQAQTENANLAETLDEFRKSTETMSGEMAALKQEVGSMQQIRDDIKTELRELLTSHFNDLDEKLSKASPIAAQAAPKPKDSEPLAAAIIEDEPAGVEEDTRLPGFEEQDETYDDDLEFLSEDDILDVDKLRGVFQSVLDNSVGDTPNSREDDDDSSSDLLFLEDILEEEHEPEVSFSLDEVGVGKESKKEADA